MPLFPTNTAGHRGHQERHLLPVCGPRAVPAAPGAVLLAHRGRVPPASAHVPVPRQLLHHRLVGDTCASVHSPRACVRLPVLALCLLPVRALCLVSVRASCLHMLLSLFKRCTINWWLTHAPDHCFVLLVCTRMFGVWCVQRWWGGGGFQRTCCALCGWNFLAVRMPHWAYNRCPCCVSARVCVCVCAGPSFVSVHACVRRSQELAAPAYRVCGCSMCVQVPGVA